METLAPATGTALLLLVAFVLPGFITLVIRENTYVVRGAVTPFERLLLSLSYSVRIYGVLIVGAYLAGAGHRTIADLYHGRRGLLDYILLGALALFVLPVVLAEVGRRWHRSQRLRPRVLGAFHISLAHSTASGWDHFFGSNTAALVRITLDDGRVVGGYFGGASLAGYSEQSHDLFLEERWELDSDDWFLRPALASVGIWLAREHIVSLEVYEPPQAPGTPAGGAPISVVAWLALIVLLWRRQHLGSETPPQAG